MKGYTTEVTRADSHATFVTFRITGSDGTPPVYQPAVMVVIPAGIDIVSDDQAIALALGQVAMICTAALGTGGKQ